MKRILVLKILSNFIIDDKWDFKGTLKQKTIVIKTNKLQEMFEPEYFERFNPEYNKQYKSWQALEIWIPLTILMVDVGRLPEILELKREHKENPIDEAELKTRILSLFNLIDLIDAYFNLVEVNKQRYEKNANIIFPEFQVFYSEKGVVTAFAPDINYIYNLILQKNKSVIRLFNYFNLELKHEAPILTYMDIQNIKDSDLDLTVLELRQKGYRVTKEKIKNLIKIYN